MSQARQENVTFPEATEILIWVKRRNKSLSQGDLEEAVFQKNPTRMEFLHVNFRPKKYFLFKMYY